MWTLETYQQIYTRYQLSGLTITDFCINERITRSRFFYWQKKYLKAGTQTVSVSGAVAKTIPNQEDPGFIPVILTHENVPATYTKKRIRNQQATASPAGSTFEISYVNGTTVRLSGPQDLELIKTLILLSR